MRNRLSEIFSYRRRRSMFGRPAMPIADLGELVDPATEAAPAVPLEVISSSLPMSLVRACFANAADGTVLLAPGGIASALKLLAAGAAGETQRQLQTITAAPEPIPAMLTGIVVDSSAQGLTLRLGNCLWLPQHLHLADAVRAVAEQAPGTMVISCAAENAPAKLNAWSAETTNGLIPTIVDTPPDPAGFVIANVVLFMGNWAEPFDPALTAPGSFHQADGTTVAAPFMTRSGEFFYARAAGGQLIDLPYAGSQMSLTIWLPDRADGLNDWLDNRDSISASQHLHTGTLRLPCLDLSFDMDLGSALSQAGMLDAFALKGADFSALTVERAPMFVSNVKQKIVIKLDESGTRAAAVTRIFMRATAARRPPPPFEMNVEHPFFFAIRGPYPHRPVFFLGRVDRL